MIELYSIETIKDEILLEALKRDHSIRDAKEDNVELEYITHYVLFDKKEDMDFNDDEKMHILYTDDFRNVGILIDFDDDKHREILKNFTENIYNSSQN